MERAKHEKHPSNTGGEELQKKTARNAGNARNGESKKERDKCEIRE